ncbi:FTR1 family iron permease [Chelatococcus reniformis]|uniref:Transport-related membrane protein n=1 Tax=Chelatococcus reniformis TaxID=1494448 RepID=A0A916UA17_9HYPH|nr:FTR1 family protein [Chelatococcus reniformis]GGC64668.1 transport-related membrane protein [Chelatococcus reniformis]
MFGALIIVFREVLEAGLVVGVVLAATRGLAGSRLYVALGIFGGVVGAAVIAGFADILSSLFDGTGQELLNAVILLVAVVMLTWTVSWMSAHARELTSQLKAVGLDVKKGRKPLTALAIVVGAAVLREGFEVVLFLYGILVGGGASAASVALGGMLGVVAGAAVAYALYRGLAAIPVKRLFQVTTVMIALLAAGLAAQAVGILQSAGYLNVLAYPLWNTSAVLPQDSIVGRVLATLIGYTDQPSGLQLIAYLATLAAVFTLSRRAAASTAPRPASSTSGSR